MKIYGYVRVSTAKQNIDRQIRNIKAVYPDAIIVADKFSGMTDDRPNWKKLCKTAAPGDRIVFDSVSRMSRNAKEGFEAYERFFSQDISLVFLKEPHINTETYRKALESNISLTGSRVDLILEGVNKYLMELAKEQIRLAFELAEKEVSDLRQRTREGIETARLNGKKIGRQPKTAVTTKKSIAAKETILKHSKDFKGNLSDTELLQLTGLSRNTYYKYKRALKNIE